MRAFVAISLGLLAQPVLAQQDVERILKRLQSIPADSSKADCEAQVSQSNWANAFDLFYGSGVCQAAKQQSEASFLMLAGQIRAMPDMGLMMPAEQKDAHAATALYGFIYSFAGGLGDEEVFRDKASRERLYALIDQWKPTYDAGYNPGWATRRRADQSQYQAALAESAAARRKTIETMSRLYSDDIYYALYRKERDLYATQKGAVDINSPVAKELGELARRMNERAIALGVIDAEMPALDEPVIERDSSEFPPETPGADEKVINRSNDPVAEKCANGAEFNAIAANSRIARVLVTTTAKWGTVWRADVEGGNFGPERHVCSANFSSSRPLELGTDRLEPLQTSVFTPAH